MSTSVYRYHFIPEVDIEQIEESLVAAIITAENLHGEVQVRLDAAHAFDAEKRSCAIDARTDVGKDINRLFLGYVTQQFGAHAVRVERIHDRHTKEAAPESPGSNA